MHLITTSISKGRRKLSESRGLLYVCCILHFFPGYFLLLQYLCCDKAMPSELGRTQIGQKHSHRCLKTPLPLFSVVFSTLYFSGFLLFTGFWFQLKEMGRQGETQPPVLAGGRGRCLFQSQCDLINYLMSFSIPQPSSSG